MHLPPFLRVPLSVLFAASMSLTSAAALALPVLINGPIAPPPAQPGTGLCSVSRASQNPTSFPTVATDFNAAINAFIDASSGGRISSVIQTPLDLSNNLWMPGSGESYGDFTNAVAGCLTGGCSFAYNDPSVSFATRLRGFLTVTGDMAGVPLTFGFYTDNAVSLTFFNNARAAYPVLIRPMHPSTNTWRTTKSVAFPEPGLYAVEVLYAQAPQHAALEMSIRQGTFTDFEGSNTQTSSLKNLGFTLVTPAMFHQSVSGQPSLPAPSQCTQCGRQYAGQSGNGDCAPGTRCNAAALCERCDTARACGSLCVACGSHTPFCESQANGFECVQCRQVSDCAPPDVCRTGSCDATKTCAYADAPDGTACQGGTCQAGTCVQSNAGTPDAGTLPPDAGGPGADGGTNPEPEPDPEGETGCGCGSGGPSLATIALLGLALLARRGRPHQGSKRSAPRHR